MKAIIEIEINYEEEYGWSKDDLLLSYNESVISWSIDQVKQKLYSYD